MSLKRLLNDRTYVKSSFGALPERIKKYERNMFFTLAHSGIAAFGALYGVFEPFEGSDLVSPLLGTISITSLVTAGSNFKGWKWAVNQLSNRLKYDSPFNQEVLEKAQKNNMAFEKRFFDDAIDKSNIRLAKELMNRRAKTYYGVEASYLLKVMLPNEKGFFLSRTSNEVETMARFALKNQGKSICVLNSSSMSIDAYLN